LYLACSTHADDRDGHLFQGGHGALGAIFLDETQDRKHEHDRQDRDRLCEFAQQARDQGGDQQDHNHRLGELGEKHAPRAPGSPLDQLIRALFAEQATGPVGVQPLFEIRAQALQSLGPGHLVPVCHSLALLCACVLNRLLG
jgi:hypothetical protein